MMARGTGYMNNIKLEVSSTELNIINCVLSDYYDFMVDYYRTKEYYECKEIKEIRDRVDALTFKVQEKIAKNQAKQPKPEW